METPNTNNEHYKMGLFYFNKGDKRVFVPKRNRGGRTLNFANIWTYVILVFIIATVICVKGLLSSTAVSNTNSHYIAGFIYYNIADPRIFIPRADGTGWTLNFANYWSYAFVGLIVLIVVYSILRSFDQKK